MDEGVAWWGHFPSLNKKPSFLSLVRSAAAGELTSACHLSFRAPPTPLPPPLPPSPIANILLIRPQPLSVSPPSPATQTYPPSPVRHSRDKAECLLATLAPGISSATIETVDPSSKQPL